MNAPADIAAVASSFVLLRSKGLGPKVTVGQQSAFMHPNGPRTIAVMQPYIFPYLGYFNLVAASTRFVFLDDVAFIKRGWVNRNRILVNGAIQSVTVPLSGASQNRAIREIHLADKGAFRTRFLRTLQFAYSRHPHVEQGLHYVEQVLDEDTDSIAELAMASVTKALALAGIAHDIAVASRDYPETRNLRGADRLIAITYRSGAACYVNAPGGRLLYTPEQFCIAGVQLRFIDPHLPPYPQTGANAFVPGLSIIDALMNCSAAELAGLAVAYSLD